MLFLNNGPEASSLEQAEKGSEDDEPPNDQGPEPEEFEGTPPSQVRPASLASPVFPPVLPGVVRVCSAFLCGVHLLTSVDPSHVSFRPR